MIDFLLAVLQAIWAILQEASFYLLVGFLLAGVLAVLVPRQLLTRLVGTGKLRSVLWGSVLGAPLPLCSCGVLPTAAGLRREGATPGATVASGTDLFWSASLASRRGMLSLANVNVALIVGR